MFEDNR